MMADVCEASVTAEGDAAAAEETAPVRAESERGRIEQIIESVLFAAAAPVSLRRLVEILEGPTAKEVQLAVARLMGEYGAGQRGIQLQEVAGGYQFRTARENAQWVRAVFRDKPARLGRAALETLAIIAYKQPVTRAEIEALRGVDVDGVVSTLLARRLIKISGRKEGLGRPLLYSTTPEFLETFGLKDLQALPALSELGPAPDEEHGQHSAEAREPQTQAVAAADDTEGGAVENVTGDAAADAATAPASASGAAADGAAAEDHQPSGDCITAQGGGADPGGEGTGERPVGDPVGHDGRSADGQDHG